MTDTLPNSVNWRGVFQYSSLPPAVEAGDEFTNQTPRWQELVKASDEFTDLTPPWQEFVKAGDATRTFRVPAHDEGLGAALFRNRADLKILASRVAMHLSNEERRSLFSAIDGLLDHTEWEDESSKIDENAFGSYLRFMIFVRPRRFPNLGVGPTGTLLAGWRKRSESIHVEFLPDDQCTALIKFSTARGPETVAWRGHVARLRLFVEDIGAIECMD